MSDWTNALVVRDRLGQLRHAGGFLDEPITAGLDPLEVAVLADTFGPMEPILGRTGLPVVTTVGDLTARHIGKRVRVEGCEYTLDHIGPSKCLFILGPGGYFPGQQFPLDTPCEVLS